MLLEVLFRAPCINGRSFIVASKVPLLYQFSYDGCVAGSNATISMLLVAVDVVGLDAQTASLKVRSLLRHMMSVSHMLILHLHLLHVCYPYSA